MAQSEQRRANGDRRKNPERRKLDQAFTGSERRKQSRRSGKDRRQDD